MRVRSVGAVVLLFVACARKEPTPTTYGIGGWDHVHRVLASQCPLPGLADPRSDGDPGASASQVMTTRMRCSNLLGLGGASIGPVSIELRGNPGTGKPVCAVRIGPGPVRGFVDLSMLAKLAEDPDLAEEIQREVSAIPPNQPYRQMTSVRGVLVRFELYESMFDGPQMELLLDGCARFPSKVEKWDRPLRPGKPLVFPE